MSYDIYFTIDTGGAEPHGLEPSFNYTYNCGPMFRKALGGDGINDLNGANAGEIFDRIDAAVRHMEHPSNASGYRAMNPSNGWGDYESALRFLMNIRDFCRLQPKTTINVC